MSDGSQEPVAEHEGNNKTKQEDPDPSIEVRPEKIHTRAAFAHGLVDLRELAGLSVRELAKKSGIPHSTLGGYFTGRHFPPLRILEQMDELLVACGVTDPLQRNEWKNAFHRARRAPSPRSDDVSAPYRGLASFETDDARWFFGRDQVLDRLFTLVTDDDAARLVMVVGPSGSGKSSLLRAGLLARVQTATDGASRWRTGLLTPGEDPNEALRKCLTDTDAATGADDAPVRSVIVIDQFEELFTRCHDTTEREAFLASILGTDDSMEASLVVVCGMRADFYTEALRHHALADALQHSQIVVAPMDEEQLRATIVEPARVSGLELGDGLVPALLRDLAPTTPSPEGAAHDPGTLPLLSHALLETWKRSSDGRLTVEDYEATGGIGQAVATSAETIYTSLPELAQELARRLFLRLVSISEDSADTRRRVGLDELDVDASDRRSTTRGRAPASDGLVIEDVVDRFVEARLLTTDADGVQISHEALLTAWPRLREWLDEDRVSLRLHRQLTDAASGWVQADRDPDLQYRGGWLVGGEEWAVEPVHTTLLNTQERESLTTAMRVCDAEQRTAVRYTRRLKPLVLALVVMLLATSGISWFTLRLRTQANAERDLALSRQLAEASVRLRQTDLSIAALLAVQAYLTSPTSEARSTLLDATALPIATRLTGPGGPAAVAVGSSGKLIAAVGGEGGLRLWNAAGSTTTGTPKLDLIADLPDADDLKLCYTAFSPDERLVAAAGASGNVLLWNIEDPARPQALPPLTGTEGTLLTVTFSPDGRTIAAAGSKSVVYRWSVQDTMVAPFGEPLTGPGGLIQNLTFNSNGTLLAAGSGDQHVYLWQLADREHPTLLPPLTGPTGTVNSLAFSPDGTTLVGGSKDQITYFWSLADPAAAPSTPLDDAGSWITAVAYNPNGSTLAVAGSDRRVRIYDAQELTLLSDMPHPGPVTGLAYAPDGRYLVSGAADGVLRVWSMPPPSPALPTGRTFSLVYTADDRLAVADSKNEFRFFDVSDPYRPQAIGPVQSAPEGGMITGTLAMAPDGTTFAIGGWDGRVWLWDATTTPARFLAEAPQTQTDIIEGMAIDPDGRLLATAGDDTTVRLYDISDPTQPTVVGDPVQQGEGMMYDTAFSPDGTILATASGGPDNAVSLFDISDPAQPRRVAEPVTGPSLQVNSVAFSPDGTTLAAGSADQTVRLLDVSDPRNPQWLGDPLAGPGGYVFGVAYSPDGNTVAAAVGDGTLWMWDVSDRLSPRPTAVLSAAGDSALYNLGFSADGTQLAGGGMSPGILLWTLDTDQAIDRICANPGDPISAKEWDQYLSSLERTGSCAV